MDNANYLKEVREQYENFPYPFRDPEEEKDRVITVLLDTLQLINHYCYRGRKNFDNYRVLVAGGGTGDAAIFMAEQLREKNGEVVYLDLSSTSMNVAKERAKIRKLENITWIQNSILEAPNLNLGTFDYINCSGVLHHLSDPDAGLAALKSVLKEDGAMGIMIYARYGRTAVYQMQELLRMLNRDEPDMHKRVQNSRLILDNIPETNWFVHSHDIIILEAIKRTDNELYDLLLHSQDRAYTVPEVYEFVEKQGLHFGGFHDPTVRTSYLPENFIRDKALLSKILTYPVRVQQTIAELLSGNLIKHTFYVTMKENMEASLEDLDNIPYFHKCKYDELPGMIINNPGRSLDFSIEETKVTFTPGKYTGYTLKYIDGKRTLKEVFDMVRKKVNKKLTYQELIEDFTPTFTVFKSAEQMLLRHKDAETLPIAGVLQEKAKKLHMS